MTIWLLIEEAESGSLAGGSPYFVISAHQTERGAEAASTAWWGEECPGGDDGAPHRSDAEGDDEEPRPRASRPDWCAVCGNGVSIDEVELEP